MQASDTENHFLLNKGTEIEVTSDEEGFKGAWYRATILESPPKSTSKKRRKALIQYKQLLADDGSTQLTEHIDPNFIRPLPPQEDTVEKVFGVNDVVDANYRDGWWTGTIRKVLEDGRFRVYFDSPPDVIDFELKDLRVHWEWVDGKWVQPEKQQSTGSIFSSGASAEVNIENKENVRDAWFPATVIKENKDGTFLVKYQKSRNNGDAGTGRVTVDSKHIRPTPPRYVDRNYELLEKVDAAFGCGWRAGVIMKILAGDRYSVSFKHENEDKEVNHSDIRPHVEWRDDKWVSGSKDILIASNIQELPGKLTTSNINKPEKVATLENSGLEIDETEEKTPLPNSRKNKMEHSIPNHEDSASDASLPIKKKMKLGNSNGSAVRSCPSKKLVEGNASNAELPLTDSQLKIMPNEPDKEASHGSAAPKTPRTGTRCLKKPVVVEQPSVKTQSRLSGKRIKTEQQRFGPEFQMVDVVKRGRPKKTQDQSSLAPTTDKSNTKSVATVKQIQSGSRKKEEETPIVVGLIAKGMTKTQPQSVTPDEELLKPIKDQKKSLSDPKGDNSMVPRSGGSSHRRKRGRPRKLVNLSRKAPEDGRQQKGSGGAADEAVSNYLISKEAELPALKGVKSRVSRDTFGGETAVASLENDGSKKEVDMSIDGVSNNSVDDDQPLSTWIGGPNSSSVEELRLSSARTAANGSNHARERQMTTGSVCSEIIVKEQVTTGMVSSEIVVKESGNHGENGFLPFVKKSPVWQTIECLEVFQIVPQHPHFRPLSDTKESYREGTAIGIMVTFAGLFEKISGLKFDDPRIVFDGTLESLLDLEKHGFDVTMLRGRLNELLSIRESQGEIIEELKDVDKKITEETQEKTQLDEEMEEIRNKIRELEEQLELKKVKKEEKDHEIARLKARSDAINERVDVARLDFEKLAATPWKLA